MRRRDILLSPSSFVAFGIILLPLLGWFAVRGQVLFSPGGLSTAGEPGEAINGWANHAEFEPQCELCHQPLKRTVASLCMDCHTDVAAEVNAAEPLHGLFERGGECLACHTEHQGADADLLALARPFFDHDLTDFSLAHHAASYAGEPLECDTCHTGHEYTVEMQTCRGCHTEDDSAYMTDHLAAFGAACLDCHDGFDRFSDFDHASTGFGLDGKHASLQCSACHSPSIPDLPTDCQGCHEEPAVHLGRYGLQCADCHTAAGWTPASFSHPAAISQDCAACHTPDRPEQHFPGQCSNCHDTAAWQPANFNHQAADVSDCAACHEFNRPANHYPGQCSACHTTVAWIPATFDHQVAGATDCALCHSLVRPANHYPGQCSACHTTTAWTPATFDHQVAGATDCTFCHSTDSPANHYAGQCSACHTTNAWLPADFNHQVAGATNCVLCHSADSPPNHFAGQCSACHSTRAWRPASFDHKLAGATDCQSCHDRPDNHFPGQCSQCHNTSNWNASFNHRFPTDHGDANGECAACHVTANFGVTCTNCHNLNEMNNEHADEGISNIAGRCLECHPTGEKDDD